MKHNQMEPNTVLTIGMISSVAVIIGVTIQWSIKIFQLYQKIDFKLLQLQNQLNHIENSSPLLSFGGLLERVNKLENDLNAVASKSRSKDDSLKRHIESHCIQISHIGEFLEDKFDYNLPLKAKLENYE